MALNWKLVCNFNILFQTFYLTHQMYFIIQIAFSYRGLSMLEEYFSSYYEMRSGTKRLQHRQFKMICGSIFSFRIFLHILFYLTDITDHDQLLFICDWVRLAALPNQLNLCSAFFLFMCAYLFFRLRYSNIDKTNQKLHSVIIIQNEQYFLQKYYHGKLSVYSYFRFYYKLIKLIIVAPMIGMIGTYQVS